MIYSKVIVQMIYYKKQLNDDIEESKIVNDLQKKMKVIQGYQYNNGGLILVFRQLSLERGDREEGKDWG